VYVEKRLSDSDSGSDVAHSLDDLFMIVEGTLVPFTLHDFINGDSFFRILLDHTHEEFFKFT